MDENNKYPYLAGIDIADKTAVVMFCEPNKGICLQNSGINNIPFGVYKEYNEDDFTYADPSVVIRINN